MVNADHHHCAGANCACVILGHPSQTAQAHLLMQRIERAEAEYRRLTTPAPSDKDIAKARKKQFKLEDQQRKRSHQYINRYYC